MTQTPTDKVRAALEKANTMLCGHGANNTVFLLDALQEMNGMVLVPVEPTLMMLADFHRTAWPDLSSANRVRPYKEAYAKMIAPYVKGE